jgi:hypothetical protein
MEIENAFCSQADDNTGNKLTDATINPIPTMRVRVMFLMMPLFLIAADRSLEDPRQCDLPTHRLSSRALGLGGTVPFICPLVDLVCSVGISLLDCSFELVVIPFYLHEIVVRKCAPLFLELTFEIVPITFEVIGVHVFPPFDSELAAFRCLSRRNWR